MPHAAGVLILTALLPGYVFLEAHEAQQIQEHHLNVSTTLLAIGIKRFALCPVWGHSPSVLHSVAMAQ